MGGPLDWRSLRRFYTELMTVAPTLGGAVALAVVIGEDEGPAAGLAQLGVIDAERLARFQPAWAARAHLHTALGDVAAASAAYAKAISLTTDAAARKYLERKQAQLPGDKPAAIS